MKEKKKHKNKTWTPKERKPVLHLIFVKQIPYGDCLLQLAHFDF